MHNPYRHILDNRTVEEVMHEAARTEESQLEQIVNSFKDNEVLKIGSWTFENLRTRGIHAVLERGCILFLYHTATNDSSNRDLFANLIKEMGVSRTQAYREMQVWRRFATLFLEKPELASSFVPEALKILAQETTPAGAREEAIELAGKGEGIDIREARQLVRKHREPHALKGSKAAVVNSTANANERRVRRPVTQAKSFIKKVIKIVRRPKKPLPRREVDAIVTELERAIQEIRVGASG